MNSLVQSMWYFFCCKFWNSEQKSYEKVIVEKTAKLVSPINLLDVDPPSSIENINILPKQ